MSENSGVNISTKEGNVSGVAGGDISGVINLGEIQGDIHNAIQQLPESSNPSQPNLKDLFNQLQTAIVDEPELDDTEKALAQVKKLAEAGQVPQDSRMKQLATKATHFLKGIAAGLTEGAKLVTAWDKVGPAIMSVFGLLSCLFLVYSNVFAVLVRVT